MGDIIQFPIHLIEKEKELAHREFELQIREQRSRILINKIITRNVNYWFISLLWFLAGSILTTLIIFFL